jgi:hypothetical protein
MATERDAGSDSGDEKKVGTNKKRAQIPRAQCGESAAVTGVQG